MNVFQHTITCVRQAIKLVWEQDPLRRRPLSVLAVQEHRIRSRLQKRPWLISMGMGGA